MSNLDLLQAGFSAIFGEDGLPSSSIHELFEATYIMEPLPSLGLAGSLPSVPWIDLFVYGLRGEIITVKVLKTYTVTQLKTAIEVKTGIDMNTMGLIYCGKILPDDAEGKTLSSYGICHGSSVFLVLGLSGGGWPNRRLDPSGLDPGYDFDFRNVKDDGKKYTRGGHQYHRPYGWNRIAVKVLSKYGEDDSWLGPNGIRTEEAPAEWPVSYHGTKFENADKIIKEGFKPGPRAAFGKAVYSSPSLEMVEKIYAKEFTHEGKSYKIAFQNRVNPARLKIIPASETHAGADYWLSQQGDIRPYGVLIREV